MHLFRDDPRLYTLEWDIMRHTGLAFSVCYNSKPDSNLQGVHWIAWCSNRCSQKHHRQNQNEMLVWTPRHQDPSWKERDQGTKIARLIPAPSWACELHRWSQSVRQVQPWKCMSENWQDHLINTLIASPWLQQMNNDLHHRGEAGRPDSFHIYYTS